MADYVIAPTVITGDVGQRVPIDLQHSGEPDHVSADLNIAEPYLDEATGQRYIRLLAPGVTSIETDLDLGDETLTHVVGVVVNDPMTAANCGDIAFTAGPAEPDPVTD